MSSSSPVHVSANNDGHTPDQELTDQQPCDHPSEDQTDSPTGKPQLQQQSQPTRKSTCTLI